MGREATITYEQVATAAEAIKAAGSKLTSRAIRERIGNIGSLGTITKLLRSWQAGDERPASRPLALPAALQSTLLDFIAQEIGNAKVALETELAEQQQESADLGTENERLAADITDKTNTIAALQTELATLQGRLSQMSTDLAAARDEAGHLREAAVAARLELSQAISQREAMQRLEAELEKVHHDLDEQRQGRVLAEQQVAVLTARLEAAMARATKAEADAVAALLQARESREAAAVEASRSQSSLANLTGKLEALQSQLQQQSNTFAVRPEAKPPKETERRSKKPR